MTTNDMTNVPREGVGPLPTVGRAAQGEAVDWPRISVALCTYNGETYLREQLDSILKQTVLPYEIVISDDGSEDGTVGIIEEFMQCCPVPVRFSQNEENLHFTGNFLHAASLCSGDYIAFCDQDDVWCHEKLHICSQTARETDAALIIHRANSIGGDGQIVSFSSHPPMRKTLYSGSAIEEYPEFVLGCCFFVKRDTVNEILNVWRLGEYMQLRQRYGIMMGHDRIIFLWCYKEKKISIVDKPLLNYRIHTNNVWAKIPSKRTCVEKFLLYFKKMSLDASVYMNASSRCLADVCLIDSMMSESEIKIPYGLKILRDLKAEKSKLFEIRAKIHADDSSFIVRVISLRELILSGAYWSGNKMPETSIFSLLKDTFSIFRALLAGMTRAF